MKHGHLLGILFISIAFFTVESYATGLKDSQDRDMMPLKVGNRWKYHYFFQNVFTAPTNAVTTTTDSGTMLIQLLHEYLNTDTVTHVFEAQDSGDGFLLPIVSKPVFYVFQFIATEGPHETTFVDKNMNSGYFLPLNRPLPYIKVFYPDWTISGTPKPVNYMGANLALLKIPQTDIPAAEKWTMLENYGCISYSIMESSGGSSGHGTRSATFTLLSFNDTAFVPSQVVPADSFSIGISNGSKLGYSKPGKDLVGYSECLSYLAQIPDWQSAGLHDLSGREVLRLSRGDDRLGHRIREGLYFLKVVSRSGVQILRVVI